MGINTFCTQPISETFYNMKQYVKCAKLSKKKKNYINAMPCCDPKNAQERRGRKGQDWQSGRAGTEGVHMQVLMHTPMLLLPSSL